MKNYIKIFIFICTNFHFYSGKVCKNSQVFPFLTETGHVYAPHYHGVLLLWEEKMPNKFYQSSHPCVKFLIHFLSEGRGADKSSLTRSDHFGARSSFYRKT